MLTLAVTSSTAVVGVALLDGNQVLASEQISTDRRHAEELTPMIGRVVEASACTLQQLDRLAVDVGPGRFTGLRVGVTTVRSLAFALDLPVVGVSSLEALALSQPGAAVTAVIDARRSEVFQQRFDSGGPIGEPTYGPPEQMKDAVADGDAIVGDGADRYVEVYATVTGATHVAGIQPLAINIGLISLDKEAVEGRLVVPVYLREPDVQVNIKTRHNT